MIECSIPCNNKKQNRQTWTDMPAVCLFFYPHKKAVQLEIKLHGLILFVFIFGFNQPADEYMNGFLIGS